MATNGRKSVDDVVVDQNVNVVYVGTMNTSHYDDTKLALEAGKHCLLEKVSSLGDAHCAYELH